MNIASKADIGKTKIVRFRDVEIKDLDLTFRIKTMTALEVSGYEEYMTEGDHTSIQTISKLLSICIVDEKGVAFLSEEDIGKMDSNVFFELGQVAVDLNDIGAENQENLEKN